VLAPRRQAAGQGAHADFGRRHPTKNLRFAGQRDSGEGTPQEFLTARWLKARLALIRRRNAPDVSGGFVVPSDRPDREASRQESQSGV